MQEDHHIFLPVLLLNPHSGKVIRTLGMVDTGATECCIPESLAVLLGHNMNLGLPVGVDTGNGHVTAFGHTTTIFVYHPQHPDSGREIYLMKDVLVNYIPNLKTVLLGVRGLRAARVFPLGLIALFECYQLEGLRAARVFPL